ncbi:unnamed protein product [Tenebrio molitor]|nr:unnamed protein product [Tenebrio molitor]
MLRHAIIVTAFCGSRDTETCTIVKWVVRAVILLFFRVDFVSFEWGTCRCERDGDSGGKNPHELQRPDRGRSRKECFQRSVSTKRSLATSSWR